MKLDYSLITPEERVDYINRLLAETPREELTQQYLIYLSNYLLFVGDKDQTKKEKKNEYPITTKNREVTVNKRQISFEGIISNLENGEDGFYALINNDKNQLLDKREPISQEDIDNIPGLKTCLETIEQLKEQFARAQGKPKYVLKKAIIESWQQAYLLKGNYKNPSSKSKTAMQQIKSMAHINLDEDIYIAEDGLPHSTAIINLLTPEHIAFLLKYYSLLKQESYDSFQGDMYFLLLDLEDSVIRTFLPRYEFLLDLIIWKIDGYTNSKICRLMERKWGKVHKEQYYSTLWKKRIPKMIAEDNQKQYLKYYYMNIKKGEWKTCSKCGETKLAHPLFFSKNTTKDGWYSICKECRNIKK